MAVSQEFNLVIENEQFESNEDLLFDLFDGEDVQLISVEFDMFDILVETELFCSKSEARKNWKRTGKDIPEGFTDIKNIGKLHHRLTIWNPMGDHND